MRWMGLQGRSRFSNSLEQSRARRILRGHAGEDQKMERGFEALGGVQSRGEHRLHFADRDFLTPDHRHGVTEYDGAVVGPDIEMAKPKIFVDLRGELDGFVVARLR